MTDDYSTPRVSRHRRHMDGDHSACIPGGNCPEATRLERVNEYHQLAVATLDELKARGISPVEFLGDSYGRVRRLADMEFPDSDYLPAEPDFVHRMNARQIEENLLVWADDSLWA